MCWWHGGLSSRLLIWSATCYFLDTALTSQSSYSGLVATNSTYHISKPNNKGNLLKEKKKNPAIGKDFKETWSRTSMAVNKIYCLPSLSSLFLRWLHPATCSSLIIKVLSAVTLAASFIFHIQRRHQDEPGICKLWSQEHNVRPH